MMDLMTWLSGALSGAVVVLYVVSLRRDLRGFRYEVYDLRPHLHSDKITQMVLEVIRDA